MTQVLLSREVIDLLAFAALDLCHPDEPLDTARVRATSRLLEHAKTVTITVDEDTAMQLRFTDGIEFNTDGPLRIETRRDGYYVVGRGMLCAVSTEAEGIAMIARLSERLPSRAMVPTRCRRKARA